MNRNHYLPLTVTAVAVCRSPEYAMRSILLMMVMLLCAAASAKSLESDDPTPTVKWGAAVFNERCVLCHGSNGRGDGQLPRSVPEYPDTSLTHDSDITVDALREAIVWGGSRGDLSPLAPPWGDELTWSEIESVVLFTNLLLSDAGEAQDVIDTAATAAAARSIELGRELFSARCALCHGQYGEGDGRLARAISNPPPANLTISVAPKKYIRKIILDGGAAIGRSGHMPPWKDELAKDEIDGVVQFIMSLRK